MSFSHNFHYHLRSFRDILWHSFFLAFCVHTGTALDSLTMMESLVRGRPARFSSLENAIEWSFRSGHIKNPESACVSMIGQLRLYVITVLYLAFEIFFRVIVDETNEKKHWYEIDSILLLFFLLLTGWSNVFFCRIKLYSTQKVLYFSTGDNFEWLDSFELRRKHII